MCERPGISEAFAIAAESALSAPDQSTLLVASTFLAFVLLAAASLLTLALLLLVLLAALALLLLVLLPALTFLTLVLLAPLAGLTLVLLIAGVVSHREFLGGCRRHGKKWSDVESREPSPP
jgi:hypothetical protein